MIQNHKKLKSKANEKDKNKKTDKLLDDFIFKNMAIENNHQNNINLER